MPSPDEAFLEADEDASGGLAEGVEESAWAAVCAASVRDNAAGCACPRSSQARLPETAAALLRPTSSHTAACWAAVPLLTTVRGCPHDPRSLFQVQQVPSLSVPCRVTCIESTEHTVQLLAPDHCLSRAAFAVPGRRVAFTRTQTNSEAQQTSTQIASWGQLPTAFIRSASLILTYFAVWRP
jgi:hypothetical protein